MTINKTIIAALVTTLATVSVANAAQTVETWTVGKQTYTSKAQAIRAIVASGSRVEVLHQRCEILTNKLTFKACPKQKEATFENEQFAGLRVSK